MITGEHLQASNRSRAAPYAIRRWVLARIPECMIFTIGVLLRLTMATGWRYWVPWGYDADAHWNYVSWIMEHASLPNPVDNYVAFHPPLYHATAAALVKLGASWQNLAWLSFACGCARLGLFWLGLEWYLPDRRARIVALSLGAILPSSILIDGMASNEVMCCTFGVAVLLLWPRAFRSVGSRRCSWACVLGLVLGLGIIVKASLVILLAAVSAGVALNLLLPPKPTEWRLRLKGLLPWAAMMAICLAVGGWFYVRNAVKYGNPFVTASEGPRWVGHSAASIPFLDRRSLGFVFGWSWDVFKEPYYPSGLQPHPRFFPVALTETFVDYYNHSFSGLRPDEPGDVVANTRPLTRRIIWLARGSVLGGSLILLATLPAWALCLRRTSRERDWGTFVLLLAPLLAVLFALSYAIKYPYDTLGIVKGTFIQFAATPLFAMFGVAVAWAAAERIRWPLATVMLLSLSLVAAYAICCRTGFLLG